MKQVAESDLAVSGKTQRIVAFDILRGLFLVIIMINHVELYPSLYDFFTGRGRLLVSAAEGFFFLSGLLIGMVYKRRISKGTAWMFRKMWGRALELYVGSVFLTLLFAYWAVATNHPAIKYGLPMPINWHYLINETLMLRFGFGWTDFLARFAILMFMAPFFFFLLSKGRWKLMLAISFGLWFFRGQNFTLGWQIIFNLGMLIGFYWHQLEHWARSLKAKTRKRIKKTAFAATGISFALSYASVFFLSQLNDHYSQLAPWLRHTTFTWNNYNADVWVYGEKWTMGPLRIVLFLLWFFVLFYFVNKYQSAISRYTKGILELFGRNSLFVYITHAVIVFTLKFHIPPQTSLWQNFMFTSLGLICLGAVTVGYTHLRANLPTRA